MEDAVGERDGEVDAARPQGAWTSRAHAGPADDVSGAMARSASVETAAQEAARRVHLPLVPRQGVRRAHPGLGGDGDRLRGEPPRKRCSTAVARYGVGAIAPRTTRASRTVPSAATSRDAHAETTAKSFPEPELLEAAHPGAGGGGDVDRGDDLSGPGAVSPGRCRAWPRAARSPARPVIWTVASSATSAGREVRRRHRLAAMRPSTAW